MKIRKRQRLPTYSDPRRHRRRGVPYSHSYVAVLAAVTVSAVLLTLGILWTTTTTAVFRQQQQSSWVLQQLQDYVSPTRSPTKFFLIVVPVTPTCSPSVQTLARDKKEKQAVAQEAPKQDDISVDPCQQLAQFMKERVECAPRTFHTCSSETMVFDRARSSSTDTHLLRQPLTAYLEAPMHDTVPGTGSMGNLQKDFFGNIGTPPDFVTPLPLRTQSPQELKRQEYPQVQTCDDLQNIGFPTDRGYQAKANGERIMWNFGLNISDEPIEHCPVDHDPYLPWIHDLWPAPDGSRIHFVAQNKRRCRNSAPEYADASTRLLPQIALLQAVSVQEITSDQAAFLAPTLWRNSSQNDKLPRYRLAPTFGQTIHNETRFICRFRLTQVVGDGEIVGETLSQYPFNYEHVSYRNYGLGRMVSQRGRDTSSLYTSTLQFSCPVPVGWEDAVASGYTVLPDGTATLTVDVVPIRTSVRYTKRHLRYPLHTGPKPSRLDAFDSQTAWGNNHVLPDIRASGRWSNIPICAPPTFPGKCTDKQAAVVGPYGADEFNQQKQEQSQQPLQNGKMKPHFMSLCTWASASFQQRDQMFGAQTDTGARLREWIQFQLMLGFDHIYVYDNSAVNTPNSSLAVVISEFPSSKVSRINWKHAVCNNNSPGTAAPGEGSSQYAAETSCRNRYGPYTDWIAFIDVDEYIIPMGQHNSLRELVQSLPDSSKVLSLPSARARMRMDHSIQISKDSDLRQRRDTSLFLEVFNCDDTGWPRPKSALRARKEIFRSDYVLHHYVHYTLVTTGTLTYYNGLPGYSEYKETGMHIANESREAVLMHSKPYARIDYKMYKELCLANFSGWEHACGMAFPFPYNAHDVVLQELDGIPVNEDGYAYNCYINARVDEVWVPRLKEYIKTRGWQN